MADNQRPTQQPPAPPPGPAAPATSPSPWPGRIAGIVVIISIIAIGLAVFLPRERNEAAPRAGQTVAENPQTPDTQVQDGYQPQNADNQAQWQPQQKLNWQQAQQSEQQLQQWQNPARQQSPQQQPQQAPAPAPTPTPQQPALATAQHSDSQSSVAPSPAPTQPAPAPAPSPTPQPTPTPAPQPSQAPRNPINQRQATQLVQNAEATERAQRNQAIDLFIGMLRQPQYQDPENWALLAAAFATTGMSMVPGGPTSGTAEIASIVTNSRNGAEAATRLERQKATSVLPRAVQRQLVQTIARATSYQDCVNGLDQVLRQSNTQLSDQTMAQLRGNVARAWQQQDQLRGQYGR